MKRSSGILMPVFSLPGKYGIGCFSDQAYEFVDFLEAAGQSYWQILPLGPTSYGDSPYQSFSTFAGNPYFISLEELIRQGFLSKKECKRAELGPDPGRIDYGTLYERRFPLLRKAFERSRIEKRPDFRDFIRKNDRWLPDYALFMALKDAHHGAEFSSWEEDLKNRKAEALEAAREKYGRDILFYEYLQYEFAREYFRLKKYANKKGIQIIGDIPIYVAYDSADFWCHPELFQVNMANLLTGVAGCPPDGFSAEGQLWGNPLYDWEKHRETGYQWWIERIRRCMELYDVLRIDHFRGLDEYYRIPAGAKNAINGAWVKGPGIELFEKIKASEGQIQVLVEDLGFITDSVRELVAKTGYPNMKVLEFAFDSRDTSGANLYLPHNYDRNCVVYTGTHDNETLVGWIQNLNRKDKKALLNYLGEHDQDAGSLARRMIRLAMGSVADTCIIPIQDYLLLDHHARINTPSTLGGNWEWRVEKGALRSRLAKKIRKLTITYGRRPEPNEKEEERDIDREK